MAKKTPRSLEDEYLQIIKDLDGDLEGRAAVDRYFGTVTGFGDAEPLSWAASPYLLTRAQYEALAADTAKMGSIMEKLMAKYHRDRTFRALFGLSPEVEEISLVPSGCSLAVPLARLNVLYDRPTSSFKVIGIVSGAIDGMAACSEMQRAIRQTGAYQAFAAKHQVEGFDAAAGLVNALLSTYGKWANAQEGRNHPTHPALAVVDIADSPRANETAYVIERLHELGVYAHATDPSELRIDRVGGIEQLVDNHGPVTCVWLRSTAEEAVAGRAKGYDTLFAATRRGLVCTVGGYRSWPVCTRSFLQVLRMRECRSLLSRDENAFIEAHIPQVERLSTASDISTYYDQENWVLRTADGHTPSDVLVGSELSRSAWRNRLVKAIKRRDAVQEYLGMRLQQVLPGTPEPDGDPCATQERSVMLSLYTFEGKLCAVKATSGIGATIGSWDKAMEMACLVVD